MKDDTIGILIILGIIAIGLFGGTKNYNQTKPQTEEERIKQMQVQVDDLQDQLKAEQDKQNLSKYYDLVDIRYVNRSNSPTYEYVTISYSREAKENIVVSGWKIKSLSSGNSTTIPFGTNLFFANMVNSEDSVVLKPGDTLYLSTGISPNGSSFRVNKCSGYLSQFQTFIPYLSSNCPRPRDEDLSSIPQTRNNDACLDYIDSFSSCRIQTESLPVNWSYECTNFIYNKINYSSCVNTHKNDKDFYKEEWRLYLKRSEPLWKNSRENIVLYDDQGKIVDSLKY